MYLTSTDPIVTTMELNFINLLNLGGQIMDFIVGNPLMLTLFSGSLVGVACYVLKKVKRTARA